MSLALYKHHSKYLPEIFHFIATQVIPITQLQHTSFPFVILPYVINKRLFCSILLTAYSARLFASGVGSHVFQ